MNYQIIWDHDQVAKFFKLFTPLQRHHSISVTLFARRKYTEGTDHVLPRSEYILSREFINGQTKPSIAVQKIWRMETPLGSYTDNLDQAIPQVALCVYSLLRVKDQIKGLSETMNMCLDSLIKFQSYQLSRSNKDNGDTSVDGEGDTSNNDDGYTLSTNPLSLFKKNIGNKTNNAIGAGIVGIDNQDIEDGGTVKLYQIDLDTKEDDKLQQVRNCLADVGLKKVIMIVIETRGGYHIIYRKASCINQKKLWDFAQATAFYKQSRDGQKVKDYWFSITNQPNVVVPGTYQGLFKAKICHNFFTDAEEQNL